MRKELDHQTLTLNEQTNEMQNNQKKMMMQGLHELTGSFQGFASHGNIVCILFSTPF
jgi:hypothetical protein